MFYLANEEKMDAEQEWRMPYCRIWSKVQRGKDLDFEASWSEAPKCWVVWIP